MKVYILGAGVSKCIGYPIGTELFGEIDKYVRESGNLVDRFNYREDWKGLHQWLAGNSNPTIVQAYDTRNIEQIFTALDFAIELRSDALGAAFAGARERRKEKADEFDVFDKKIEDYQRYRSILLWALEHYFAWRHWEDYGWKKKNDWKVLSALAEKLKSGDVAITFNYDGTLERVLLDQRKWSPKDGWGFPLVFQRSRYDKTPVDLRESPVRVLHLHGMTGWYRRPTFAPDYSPPETGGTFLPREAFGAAPMETKISVDPKFLTDFGLHYVDACLPDCLSVANERHIVLHPSFLKDYETDESGSNLFIELWRAAARALREAEHTYIIGYSLPKADVAALTLFLTTLRRGAVTVVNPSRYAITRLSRLFASNPFAEALTLKQWLDADAPARLQSSLPWNETGTSPVDQ